MCYIQERREIKMLAGKPTSHLEGIGIDRKILKRFFNRAPGVEYIHLMQYWDQWHALRTSRVKVWGSSGTSAE
jgi:hypothetical protein